MPTRRMSPILAMPTTTVVKMMTGTTARISDDEGVAQRLHVDAEARIVMPEEDADRDRDQHLDVKRPEPRRGYRGAL